MTPTPTRWVSVVFAYRGSVYLGGVYRIDFDHGAPSWWTTDWDYRTYEVAGAAIESFRARVAALTFRPCHYCEETDLCRRCDDCRQWTCDDCLEEGLDEVAPGDLVDVTLCPACADKPTTLERRRAADRDGREEETP